jgi:isoleucine--tRNA ligase
MFKKVDSNMNFVEREREVEDFWKKEDIFRKSIEEHKGDGSYVFYDGPPTANGKPHIGHVETRAFKDMIPRYHAMKGSMVPRKAGWDTHGLPVELEIEKEIGINGKEQIEAYGVAPFIDLCKKNVWKYKGMWEDFSYKVGFWADMEDPYVTYHDDFIESEWWALKEIWKRKLLYKGFKVVPYCPRCGTPLSSHEVAQGYKEITERSAVVRFKMKGEEGYFLAWTTTPWTLPSNVALCVHPDLEYAKVKAADGNLYILAVARLDAVLSGLAKEGEEAYKVLETCKGKDLVGLSYEPLYAGAEKEAEKQHKKACIVVSDYYVSAEDGTGIVHIAPAFGEDDGRIGRANDLALVKFVDSEGKLTEETPFCGMRCKPTEKEMQEGAVSADPEVLKDLEKRGLLFDAPKFTHSYPHCWRCNTPLIYYARESWFIKMSAVKDELVKNNNTVHWIPESIGKGRFGDWIENVQDWSLSRDRYWGTPLNIWECETCGHQDAIGSIEELRERSGNYEEVLASLKAEGEKGYSSDYVGYEHIELHKPYVDRLTMPCPHCGKTMRRVPEVIDCWFDSGAMPYAQHHYPFENKALFESQFPAQFICEAVDQTRGWFYSLLAESTLLFHKAPFENVLVLGHVQDENGQKMSKSKGNAVDPMEALKKHGADAIRWFFYTNSAPWLPNRFHDGAVVEGQRKFLSTLWNTYAFFVLYANIDSFDPTKYSLHYESLSTMDKWLLSKLNSLILTVDKNLSDFRIPEAANALEEFSDELSNWYVRRSRERFWAKGMEEDKVNAYMTLYETLVSFVKLAAPMVPFITESIYRNLVCSVDKTAPESVHLCAYPVANPSFILKDLEENMEEVLSIVKLGRAAREKAQVKNRQPLSMMYISGGKPLGKEYESIVREELNVKSIDFKEDLSSFTAYIFKPQLKTVGPKYGKHLQEIRNYLTALDSKEGMQALSSGAIRFTAKDGTEVSLTREDLLIESTKKDGYITEEDGKYTVVLDTNLTEELKEEGFLREIISKVQTMRKEAGFEVTDRIRLFAKGNEKLISLMRKSEKELSTAVLAESLVFGECKGYEKDWDINGENVCLSVEKV